MAFKLGMAVGACMAYMLMDISMNLTLTQGHIGPAEEKNQCWIISTNSAIRFKLNCFNGRPFFPSTWPWLWTHLYGLTILLFFHAVTTLSASISVASLVFSSDLASRRDFPVRWFTVIVIAQRAKWIMGLFCMRNVCESGHSIYVSVFISAARTAVVASRPVLWQWKLQLAGMKEEWLSISMFGRVAGDEWWRTIISVWFISSANANLRQ